MRECGFPPPFEVDFSLPGVTSMSIDTHKYAFCAKGTSVLLYSTTALRRYQYTPVSDWTGGIYATPAVAGSRTGALAASAWATLTYFGRAGYVKELRKILVAAKSIDYYFRDDPEINTFLERVGMCDTTVICFKAREDAADWVLGRGGSERKSLRRQLAEKSRSKDTLLQIPEKHKGPRRMVRSDTGEEIVFDPTEKSTFSNYRKESDSTASPVRNSPSSPSKSSSNIFDPASSVENLPLNIYGVYNCLTKVFGWNLNSLQNPASLHICVTLPIASMVDEFVLDVKAAIYLCRRDGEWNAKGKAGIYGTAASVPSSIADELTKIYLDACGTAWS